MQYFSNYLSAGKSQITPSRRISEIAFLLKLHNPLFLFWLKGLKAGLGLLFQDAILYATLKLCKLKLLIVKFSNLAHYMECFLNPLDVSRASVLQGAHRKCL